MRQDNLECWPVINIEVKKLPNTPLCNVMAKLAFMGFTGTHCCTGQCLYPVPPVNNLDCIKTIESLSGQHDNTERQRQCELP